MKTVPIVEPQIYGDYGDKTWWPGGRVHHGCCCPSLWVWCPSENCVPIGHFDLVDPLFTFLPSPIKSIWQGLVNCNIINTHSYLFVVAFHNVNITCHLSNFYFWSCAPHYVSIKTIWLRTSVKHVPLTFEKHLKNPTLRFRIESSLGVKTK